MLTCNIAKKGFSGMRSSSPATISLYFDSDVLLNPFLPILASLATIIKLKHIIINLNKINNENKKNPFTRINCDDVDPLFGASLAIA